MLKHSEQEALLLLPQRGQSIVLSWFTW